jgi:hypothetical protein
MQAKALAALQKQASSPAGPSEAAAPPQPGEWAFIFPLCFDLPQKAVEGGALAAPKSGRVLSR